MEQHGKNGTGYEVQDASVREVVLTGAGIIIGTFIVCLLMWGLFNALKTQNASEQTYNPLAGPTQLPPEPRLESKPWLERENLNRHETEILETYGWVDKGAGKVRIPIDRAMDVIAERGLPARGGANARR